LWADACAPNAPDPEDIIRFNEAIDQAVAESVRSFSAQVDLARNLLLGMITHDMRNPLQTIQLTARYLASINAGEQVSNAAFRVIRSGARIQALLDDLVDFDRTKLGLAIPIVRISGDLAPLFKDEVEQLRILHPDRVLELEVVGDTRGNWDGPRLQRVLGNLLVNAIKYGDQDAPVRVVVAGEENEVRFEVRNVGPTIEQSTLDCIFDPLRRGLEHGNEPSTDGSLGLGLYIAREISHAHGGEITVRSDNKETVFSVRLPRREGLL
jgi:signal transduction histidine kinase